MTVSDERRQKIACLWVVYIRLPWSSPVSLSQSLNQFCDFLSASFAFNLFPSLPFHCLHSISFSLVFRNFADLMFIHFRKVVTPLKPKLSNSLTKLYSHLPLKLKHSPLLNLPSQHSPETLTRSQLKALVLSRFSQGKFFDLFQNVVASPSVLLTASQNLITPPLSNAPDSLPLFDLVSNCFSVEVMARELSENRFDVGACCVRMVSLEGKGA